MHFEPALGWYKPKSEYINAQGVEHHGTRVNPAFFVCIPCGAMTPSRAAE